MQRTLTPAERLIVAADFKPSVQGKSTPDFWVRSKVIELAGNLAGTGVYLKVGSALRVCGYQLIKEIHDCGLKVFADLELSGTSEMLSTDGMLLREVMPEILTTVCVGGVSAMRTLKVELPNTEVLGVATLAGLIELYNLYSHGRDVTVIDLAKMADEAGLDGIISTASHIAMLRPHLSERMSFNSTGIFPEWAIAHEGCGNLSQVTTPASAFNSGANRIIVGPLIIEAENVYDAVMRTIEEISESFA